MVSLAGSNENLFGLIIAQGVFGLGSHSAVCGRLAVFQTGNSITKVFHGNFDLSTFLPLEFITFSVFLTNKKKIVGSCWLSCVESEMLTLMVHLYSVEALEMIF